MADDDDAASAVLSDVDDSDDPSPLVLPPPPPSASSSSSSSSVSSSAAAAEQRLRDLTVDLDEERRQRRAAEDRLNRLKAFAQDVIRKRDEFSRAAEDAVKSRNDALRTAESASSDLAAARADLAAARAEAATASSMLSSGLEKISGKIAAFKSFDPGLPKSQKYSGLPAVAYGVVKRANEIVEEMLKQIESAAASRDRAREQMEQRNYEIAIEVSELEATIAALRAEVATKNSDMNNLTHSLTQKDDEILELRKIGQELDEKTKTLEATLDAQKPVLAEQLSCVSKMYEKMHEIIKAVDLDSSGTVDSSFIWKETDANESLKASLEGMELVYELATTAEGKARARMEERSGEVRALSEKIEELLAEKQHIGVLLRSALLANTNEVLQVAEDGLREAGIDLRLDGHNKHAQEGEEQDEVYTLAGALENTVKESQLKIIELQHLAEALRAESGLLRARLEGQDKEIGQLRQDIKQLEEKERVANDSVEGLMMDVTAAEEEIKRWKMAAEEEAEAGRAIEQEFQTQMSALRNELDEAKQAMLELENKLKFKEETAAAAMAARDAAEKSLKLADMRSSRLRERLEELNRQLEESDNRDDSINRNSNRYMCWPWQWLGLNFVRLPQPEIDQNSNEMELSEPLV